MKKSGTVMKAFRGSPEMDIKDPDGKNKCCPKGYHKINIRLAPNQDFHVYRQDSDGKWSHVLGDEGIFGDIIDDLTKANHDYSKRGAYNYSKNCGIICVRTAPTAKEIQEIKDFVRGMYRASIASDYITRNGGRELSDTELDKLVEEALDNLFK